MRITCDIKDATIEGALSAYADTFVAAEGMKASDAKAAKADAKATNLTNYFVASLQSLATNQLSPTMGTDDIAALFTPDAVSVTVS